MSSNDLANQLIALSDSLNTANSLISRLSKLQFQPGSEPLQGDGVRVELAQDIHDSLKQLEEELEFLKQEAEDYKAESSQRRRQSIEESDEARITAKLARVGEELKHSRQQFRNAQVAAKFASERAKRQERELILEGYRKEAEQLAAGDTTPVAGGDRDQLFARRTNRTQQQKQLTKDEILANASTDVTAALRRTHDLLSSELSRSRFAQETFDESTTALSQLGEDYSNLDTILANSRNLLGTLLRSQKSDTWYLETAFYILLTTLCWLFFRRILFGPFVKLPIFLWNVSAFLLNWVILKPLYLVFSAAGVVSSTPAASKSLSVAGSNTRTSLIVKPSATGRGKAPGNLPRGGIPAGAGGAGAKIHKEHPVSEAIGKMAEESARQSSSGGDAPPPPNPNKKSLETSSSGNQKGEGEEVEEPPVVVRRGDGTILPVRKDEDGPPNPKKRMFEAGGEREEL